MTILRRSSARSRQLPAIATTAGGEKPCDVAIDTHASIVVIAYIAGSFSESLRKIQALRSDEYRLEPIQGLEHNNRYISFSLSMSLILLIHFGSLELANSGDTLKEEQRNDFRTVMKS